MKLATGAPASTLPAWMVELETVFTQGRHAPRGLDELQVMVELMQRSDGVRAVAVVPRRTGLAVAASVRATDAVSAVRWARALAAACARRAGLGEIAMYDVQIAAEPGPGALCARPDRIAAEDAGDFESAREVRH